MLAACSGSGRADPESPGPIGTTTAVSVPAASTPAIDPNVAPVAAAPGVPVDPAALVAGQVLASPSSLDQVGGYRLQMQDNGDLVLIWDAVAVLWSTGTGGHPGSRAVLQPDGDFVVADPAGTVLWSAGTAGSGAIQVRLTQSGELSIVAPAGGVWAAGSAGHRGRIESIPDAAGTQELHMQDDGNFVLSAAGAPVWSTKTSGRPGAIAELQPDGNLVVSAPDSGVLWTSGTAGSGATELVLSEGNVELQTTAGARVWQAIAPVSTPSARPPAAPRASATSTGSSGAGAPTATEPAVDEPPAPAAPVANDHGLAGSLVAELNAYRQQNGLNALQVSSELNGYAGSCASAMAAADAPLAHCRSGEIIQYNTDASPHAWLVAYQNSPAHNSIMLMPDIKYIGGGVCLSAGGRYYSVINVSY